MDDKPGVISIKEFAGRILDDASKWVLFLGDRISYDQLNNRKKLFSDLAIEASREKETDPLVKTKIMKAVQGGDYTGLSGILFGNRWDGASFLDEVGEAQMKWRERYAKELVKREKINISNAPAELGDILKIFPGIILTTCQDETIEAFLEYEKSMPVDDTVFTPYNLEVSEEWDRWIKDKGVRAWDLASREDKDIRDKAHILVKLYGSRKNPYKMLLSEKDFEECYSEKSNAHLFLKKIFRTKNLLFVGMDLGKEGPLSHAEGILKLLEEEPGDVERYLLDEEGTGEGELARYHIKPVKAGEGGIKEFGRKLEKQIKDLRKEANKTSCREEACGYRKEEGISREIGEDAENNGTLDQRMALEQFELFYNRRSHNEFLKNEKEMNILKVKILGFGENGRSHKQWNKKSIEQLAVAANNVADFYDLEEIFSFAEKACLNNDGGPKRGERTPGEFYEMVTRNMLNERLSARSRYLHQILSFYGSGFPFGFLMLLSKDEEELKKWKRAGIQLTNSGIYVKRHHRKNLHERMFHADNVMRTAGTNPYKKKFKNIIKERCRQPGEGYFYPLDSTLINEGDKEKEKEKLEEMFVKMHHILRDKSEGYKQLHSLLQTEMPEIINNMRKLESGRKQWEPAMLYYLLRESRAIPRDRGILREEIKDCFAKASEALETENRKESRKALLDEVMLLQTESLIESQSYKKENQNQAIGKCIEAENLIDREEKKGKWKRDETPEQIFEQRIQICLLKARIYGRLSSILEIERCRKKEADCSEQKSMLKKMNNSLEYARRLIRTRESLLGSSYEEIWAEWDHLKGEYYFKMSQFHWENRQYSDRKEISREEKESYKRAEEHYGMALSYYGKYPYKFWIQRADVMRNMADLYCQKGKSIEDGKDKESLREQCYNMLMEAYVLYRSNGDLHGIADVLQSMGNVEDFHEIGEKNRSPLCFYKVSKDLYDYLNDDWSSAIVGRFHEEAEEKVEAGKKNRLGKDMRISI